MNAPFRPPPRQMRRPLPMKLSPPVRTVRAGTTSVAPVCPISRPQEIPPQPGIKLPTPTLAFDLPSAIQAINTLVTAYNQKSTNVRWVERERTTQNVRIFNQNDNSQYIDVVRIVKLIMEDVITGELWWWELGGSVAQQLGINLLD